MLNSINKQFFINQLVWIGISFGISIKISMLIPFPILLVVIVGIFLLLNFYLRKRMISRIGSVKGTIMGGIFSPTSNDGRHATSIFASICWNLFSISSRITFMSCSYFCCIIWFSFSLSVLSFSNCFFMASCSRMRLQLFYLGYIF